jgi:hypothetical protein
MTKSSALSSSTTTHLVSVVGVPLPARPSPGIDRGVQPTGAPRAQAQRGWRCSRRRLVARHRE